MLRHAVHVRLSSLRLCHRLNLVLICFLSGKNPMAIQRRLDGIFGPEVLSVLYTVVHTTEISPVAPTEFNATVHHATVKLQSQQLI